MHIVLTRIDPVVPFDTIEERITEIRNELQNELSARRKEPEPLPIHFISNEAYKLHMEGYKSTASKTLLLQVGNGEWKMLVDGAWKKGRSNS
jgi:hypothetical protein